MGVPKNLNEIFQVQMKPMRFFNNVRTIKRYIQCISVSINIVYNMKQKMCTKMTLKKNIIINIIDTK